MEGGLTEAGNQDAESWENATNIIWKLEFWYMLCEESNLKSFFIVEDPNRVEKPTFAKNRLVVNYRARIYWATNKPSQLWIRKTNNIHV